MQADAVYNFTKDDLVIVEWTNITRNDDFINNTWQYNGNVFNQSDYNSNLVNINKYALRDFAVIKSTYHFLTNKCQSHMLSMCNLNETFNQYQKTSIGTDSTYTKISNLYQPIINAVLPSFYKTLWNNDIRQKRKTNTKELNCYFYDMHPNVLEHFTFLAETFNYSFQVSTVAEVNTQHNTFVNYIKDFAKRQKTTTRHVLFKETVLNDEISDEIHSKCSMRDSDIIDRTTLIL